jgi:hypothetical protein
LIQIDQIKSKLELLIWRLLPPQFAEKEFGDASPFEAVEEKFTRAAAQYYDFFDSKTHFTAPNAMAADCVECVAPLVPEFFQQCTEIMPQKRAAEMLIYANISICFTEHALLMHNVR